MLDGPAEDDTVLVDWGSPGEAEMQQIGQIQK